MCDAYPTKPKRDRTDSRMILHVEGVHGQRYRDWCAANGVTVRNGLGKLYERLDASEVGRLLALEQADSWRQAARQISEESGAEIAELSGQLSACRRQIAECEGLRRAAVERANRLEREADITACDHVRAAVGKRPVVTAIPTGLALFGLFTVARIVWGIVTG